MLSNEVLNSGLHRRCRLNSTLAIGGVSSALDSFLVAESLVLRTNFCAEKPAHRQSAKNVMFHYDQPITNDKIL